MLENVSVEKKANFYFDGKVTSRNVLFADGSKKTLGIMLPGEYEFNTSQKELVEITSGEIEVCQSPTRTTLSENALQIRLSKKTQQSDHFQLFWDYGDKQL